MHARNLTNNMAKTSECAPNLAFQLTGLATPGGVLLEVNRGIEEGRNGKESDLVGRPLWEMPCWKDDSEVQHHLCDAVQAAARGQRVRYAACRRTPDGTIRFIDFMLRPLTDQSGGTVYIIPTGCDIADLKDVEGNLRQQIGALAELLGKRIVTLEETKEELRREISLSRHNEQQMGQAKAAAEDASKAKSRYIAHMGHELHSLLNTIEGFVRASDSRISDSQVKKLLRELQESAEHLTALVGEAQDISGDEVGAPAFESRSFNIMALRQGIDSVLHK